jgi:hypothetical protein
MRPFLRFTCLLCVFLLGFASASFAQNNTNHVVQPADAQPDASALVGYQEMPPLSIHDSFDFMNNEAGPSSSAVTVTPGSLGGVVSVPNFVGSFTSGGKTFPFVMMGQDPALGSTTNIPAKIVAVSLVLQNADLTTTTVVPVAPFEELTTHSPNFKHADYSVGHVQFADAVQRAEFFNHMGGGWHTQLDPVTIVERVSIFVPFTVVVKIHGVATTVRTYFTRQSPDGNTVVFLLQSFFNNQFSNVEINAINNNDFTTDAINLQLYPNVFLFTPSTDPLHKRGPCCVLGFHTFFFDPSATPIPVWISAYTSWISPGTFLNPGILDVTAVSHEISESFNDPFLNNATPRWQFPGEPGVCQGNLETGDPVEVLANPTVPVTIGQSDQQFVYHPQTEALVQWFTQSSPSDAFQGAFSYPNTGALTGPATPCP